MTVKLSIGELCAFFFFFQQKLFPSRVTYLVPKSRRRFCVRLFFSFFFFSYAEKIESLPFRSRKRTFTIFITFIIIFARQASM